MALISYGFRDHETDLGDERKKKKKRYNVEVTLYANVCMM